MMRQLPGRMKPQWLRTLASGCHQCGGNHLVVGPAPMAVVHGLTARSCPDTCVELVLRKEMDATGI